MVGRVLSENSAIMASTFGCMTSEKIEIKDVISQCKCQDGSACVWTKNRKPVYGCPCPTLPENPDYTCVNMANILGCSDKKVECTGNFGQCECEEGKGLCFWSGDKPMGGCPCKGGRLPKPNELKKKGDQPKKKKKAKKPKVEVKKEETTDIDDDDNKNEDF